jgi:hypothetical protein
LTTLRRAVPDEEKPEEKSTDPAEKTEAPKEAEEDEAGIDAIAKRALALGGDDETDRIAREEEEKLAARRAKQRGGKKKGAGLESAASKRLAKIGAKAKPKRAVPDAVEAADPLIERTQRLAEWARKNRNLVQGGIVVAVLAAIGGGIWAYLDAKHSSEASTALAQAVADERGRIGDPDQDDEGIHDTTPIFKTEEARRDAALAKYREVETKFKGTGAAWLAKLGEGSLLLDKRDPDGAIAAFEAVQESSLAKADPEVRGRVLENLGFAYELKAEMKPEEKKQDLDKAIEQYKALEATDIFGFVQLAPYHEARCYELEGEKDKAIQTLKQLREELMKNADSRLFGELRELTDDRLRALDPTAVPPKRNTIGAGGEIDPSMLEKLPPELRERVLKNLGKEPQ